MKAGFRKRQELHKNNYDNVNFAVNSIFCTHSNVHIPHTKLWHD